MLSLFRWGLKYLIFLVLGTLLYVRLVSSIADSVANYLYGTNITWTYGWLGNLAPDGTCEIDVVCKQPSKVDPRT